MKIVVLDGQCLNPGDLSWDSFGKIGELEVYDISPPESVFQRSRGATALITNKTILDAPLMERLPELKYIGILATGYNVVDLEAAKKHDITITNVPQYSTPSVVQCVFAHLLNLTFHLSRHDRAVKAGDWAKSPHFCFWNTDLVELAGQNFGIVGFGTIGQAVARIAQAFQMNVLAYGPRLKEGTTAIEGVRAVALDQLLRDSDVVSLHCPLNNENAKMVDGSFLAKMKRSAFLINTARGGLIDETALAKALEEGQIAAAGLDVLASEPPQPDNPLVNAKNCFITPHIAWATHASRSRLMEIAAENLRQFLLGSPQNVVS